MPENYTGPGVFKRFLLGALLVVVASASATAVAAFHEIDKVVEAFRENPPLELGEELSEADAGKPQTIMLIGSDRRARGARDFAGGAARSDTIILMRLDPDKGIALLSLPRDLKVRIPGHGVDKINAAYSIGGAKLTLRTVKELTGLRINHVINIDFRGFREAVDAIDCVFVDIDRRYFNDNSGGEGYAAIDIKQGYQRLCGEDALAYVRYRHEDHDLVRAARQQEFLRQARGEIDVEELVKDRNRFIDIFGRNTRSDIRSRKTVIRLLKLVIDIADKPIREVHFQAELGASFVEASSDQIEKVTDEFLDVRASSGPRGELEAGNRPRRRPRRRSRQPADLGLEDAPGAGREQAIQAIAAGVKFPVFYPRKRTKRALFAGEPRVYGLRAPNGRVYNSYRMVIKRGLVGEYYGLQGTTWKDPPILSGPHDTRKIGGREYRVYYDGDRVRLVAWETDEAVYWVSNTLLQTLTERQLLAIARSSREL